MITINTLREKKAKKEPIVGSTCYNYWQAQICADAKLDWCLVGDSAANVELGYKSTVNITLEECLTNCRAVARGNQHSFLVGDMPFGSYSSDYDAVKNAEKFIEAGMHCIKLEGLRIMEIIRTVNCDILVFGHLGLTPQSVNKFGGYKSQGRTINEGEEILKEAKMVESAGAHLLLLEAMPPETANKIAEELTIPVISIGAGNCDGQLLIFHDIVGLFKDFKPKFAKQYCDAYNFMSDGVAEYVKEVREGLFPSKEYLYRMKKNGL